MKAKQIIQSGVIAVSMMLTSQVSMAEDIKIGVVNAVKVLEGAPQADVARKLLQKEFAPKDKKLVAVQKAIKSLEEKLSKDAAIMSESKRKGMEREIVNKRRDLKRSQDEFREDLNFRRNEEFGKIQKQIVIAIQTIAKEEKYDLVIGEGVVFASGKVDLTAKVIERLKK